MMDKLREARARAEEAVSDHVIMLYGYLIWLHSHIPRDLIGKESKIALKMRYERKHTDVNDLLLSNQDLKFIL